MVNMTFARIILAALASLLAFTHTAILADQSFVFYGNAHYPPFIYQENGETVGMAVDLAKAVIERAQIPAQFVPLEWKAAQERVKSGDGDALVLINKNPEREAIYDFSELLLKSEYVIFRKSVRSDVNDMDALDNKLVGFEKGGYTESILRQHPKVQRRIVADISDALDLLERNQIDAFITERWAGEFALARLGKTNVVSLEPPVESSASFIAVRKGNPQLLEKINLGLRLIDADGTRAAIQNRWSNKEVVRLTKSSFSYYQLSVALAIVTVILLGLLATYARKLARHREQLESKVNARTLELATARAEAERANAVKTRFLANVSHEMRTPLQLIVGFAEVGRTTIDETSLDVTSGYFDTIHTAGMQLTGTVRSMLELADKAWNEHVSGPQEQMQEIELVPFVEAIGYVTDFLAKKADQRLIVDMQSTRTTFRGDPGRLRQLFEYLMGNAVRYSPAGASTTLRVADGVLGRADSPEALPAISFQLIDQGCGIPAKEMSTVFEPFYESTRTESGAGGTGLGLSLSLAIVTHHHGTISLRNNPEVGLTCEVILPCLRVDKTNGDEPSLAS